MDDQKRDPANRSNGAALKIVIGLASTLPFIGTAALRPLLRHHPLWGMVLLFIAFIPLLIAFAIAKVRRPTKAISNIEAPSAKKTILFYALLNDRWRTSLTVFILLAWFGLSGIILAIAYFLTISNAAFARLATTLGTTLDGLILGTVSLIVVFAIAAWLGPRLIKLTTGRMPMGRE
ncbi:MAG: hypothetical protein V4527_14860 [Pseudomonadota bacterium]